MINDHVEHRGFDQTFHVVIFFVLNYVHCLLQVISFYMFFSIRSLYQQNELVLLYRFVIHFMR
jgi:hypothetical protein